MSAKKPSLYLVSILLLTLILPIAFILFQWLISKASFGWLLIGKWYVFWAVGIRLFIAGARQVTKPAFTAKEIFHIEDEASYVVIKELGFGNISLGVIGILSIIKAGWCAPVAIAGGLFYGFAGIQHILNKPASKNEKIAMISDLYIFLILALYAVFTL